MYIRIYPNKQNTIFKDVTGAEPNRNGDVNTGSNPIMELRDGGSESILVLSFDIDSVRDRLNNYPFEATLKLWDAGVVREPSTKLKEIDLVYFEEDFIEGDGWFFFGDDKIIQGPSNWNTRDGVNDWDGVVMGGGLQGTFPVELLNKANDDLALDTTSFIGTALTNIVNPKFAIKYNAPETDDPVFTKFIHSAHTRTMFRPYLELKIADEVKDKRHDAVATKSNRFYLLNQTGEDFVATTIEANVTDGTTTLESPTVENPQPGVYYIDYTPPIGLVDTIVFDEWILDGDTVAKNLIKIVTPNQVIVDNDANNGLFFHPAFSYSHTTVRQNDIVKFKVISQIRGKGSRLQDQFQYRIIASNRFEMIPWTDVSTYNGEHFFVVETDFFFPEIEYEVFVRLKGLDGSIKTSTLTQKFRLVEDEATHLQSRAASPYNSRNKINDL